MVTLDKDGEGAHGRARTVGSDMPVWVAEGLLLGPEVGGTCLTCGNIISIGAGNLSEFDFEEGTASADTTRETTILDRGAEPGTVVSPGKRARRRGAGSKRGNRSGGGSV